MFYNKTYKYNIEFIEYLFILFFLKKNRVCCDWVVLIIKLNYLFNYDYYYTVLITIFVLKLFIKKILNKKVCTNYFNYLIKLFLQQTSLFF